MKDKQNVCILMESADNIVFGAFISSKIKEKVYQLQYTGLCKFLFSFKNNKPMKFNLINPYLTEDDNTINFYNVTNSPYVAVVSAIFGAEDIEKSTALLKERVKVVVEK